MNTKQPKSAGEATRTVLMVDAQGRMRTIERFNQKLRIGIILLAGALLVAAGAGWLYIDGLGTQQALRQKIDALEARVKEAEHQTELLMARAIKAEARITPAKSAQASKAPVKAAPLNTANAEAKRPPGPADEPAAVRPAAKPEVAPSPPPKVSAVPERAVGVAIEKLTVAYRRSDKVITSAFTIRNTGNGQVQGRAIVVLSAKEGGNTPHLSLPAVPLNNGRPQGDAGSRFAIKNYMRLKINRKVALPGLKFDTAEVFVFDMQGRRLQAKTFAVQLKIPEALPPEPVAAFSDGQPAVSEAVAPPPNSILVIPSNSRQESQGGQETE